MIREGVGVGTKMDIMISERGLIEAPRHAVINLGVINKNAPTAGTRATSTSIVILTILVGISLLTMQHFRGHHIPWDVRHSLVGGNPLDSVDWREVPSLA